MGSASDRETMETGKPYYDHFAMTAEFRVASAHRDPSTVIQLAKTARQSGYVAIVCGAGMAAHLAGVCAASSDLPVIAVPLKGGLMDGLDALLSSVQMPAGVPVATLAVGRAGAINAALLCARIIGVTDETVRVRLAEFISAGCQLPDGSR